MSGGIWSLAKLSPEQERHLKDLEGRIGNGVLLAYARAEFTPARLNRAQLEELRKLEEELGLVILAVKPD
jgi:hypothetical protein